MSKKKQRAIDDERAQTFETLTEAMFWPINDISIAITHLRSLFGDIPAVVLLEESEQLLMSQRNDLRLLLRWIVK